MKRRLELPLEHIVWYTMIEGSYTTEYEEVGAVRLAVTVLIYKSPGIFSSTNEWDVEPVNLSL